MHVCCSVKIAGRENINKLPGNAIIATNHVTEIDPLLIVAALPFSSELLPLIFVARERKYYKTRWQGLRRVLYGGVFFRLAGGYEAYGGMKDYEKALRNHLKVLEEGGSVCIFPVGRLHDAEAHKEAKGGVGYLVARTGLPVLPMHIQGIHRKTTLWDCLRRRPKVTITIGEPIFANDIFVHPMTSDRADTHHEYQAAAVILMERIMNLASPDAPA